MSEPDVVGALDRWLWAHDYDGPIRHEVVQRARDEIVALRAFKARVFADVRDEALEEAARACEDGYTTGRCTIKAIAAAIRALKERPRQP